jgi:hypothetical protein|nr:MAG TPA: hypothetical protein [Caudoviricetes sp.]
MIIKGKRWEVIKKDTKVELKPKKDKPIYERPVQPKPPVEVMSEDDDVDKFIKELNKE